ncbi:MAG TPA: hypothetical protein VK654_17170 [Nitrospirota bacterium]|nr:hypothetical protein [Nitrospirota bacterium]
MFRTKSVLFVLLAAVFVFAGAGVASAQLIGSVKDVVESAGSSGKVDWTTGVITAVGIGAPPAQPANAAQARAMAERAAQVVAYRNLLEAVKGVRVDSTTTVENFMVSSDIIRTEVSGIIQGATVMDKKYMSDGSVEVTVGMKLTGALAEALLPKSMPGAPGMPAAPAPGMPAAPAAPAPAQPGQLYTGLIVDGRGLGVRPAMSPKIMSEEGKEIYGSAMISRDYAVREGMAGYMKDPAAAAANPRVADKPLTVKALKVSGDSRVDLVVSNADATTIQNAAQNMSMLEKCKVIILVD